MFPETGNRSCQFLNTWACNRHFGVLHIGEITKPIQIQKEKKQTPCLSKTVKEFAHLYQSQNFPFGHRLFPFIPFIMQKTIAFSQALQIVHAILSLRLKLVHRTTFGHLLRGRPTCWARRTSGERSLSLLTPARGP